MTPISKFYKTILIAFVLYLFVQTTNVAYADINTTCSGNLSVANTRYVLTGNTAGSCTITANNITIDGLSLYTINGNVTAGNSNSFTIQNVTVTGFVSGTGSTGSTGSTGVYGSNGGTSPYGFGYQGYAGGPGGTGGTGGTGPSITLSNSIINGTVSSVGGQGGQGGRGGAGGQGGYSNPGPYSIGGQGGYGGYGGQGGTGGNAGTISISGSTVSGAITTSGGAGGIAGSGGYGGGGGYGSYSYGSNGYNGGSYGPGVSGTGGGNISVATSTVSTVTVIGTISVSTSTATTIRSSSTSAKTFNVASTTFSSLLTTSNNASPITVSAPTLSLSSKTISATSSALTLNYTDLVTNSSTRFSSLASLTINGRNYGAFAGGIFNPSVVGIVTPTANSTLYTWTPDVDWSQSVEGLSLVTGCQYSFGDVANWNLATNDWDIGSPEVGTWQGASCVGTGNDINAPPEWGTTTLAIRAFTTGLATSSDTVTFLYAPSRSLYFYNDGSDSSWTTIGNWFTDLLHTSSTGGVLPSYVDVVTVSGSTAPLANLDTWTQPSQINAVSIGVSFTSSSNASTSITINGPIIYNGSAKNNGVVNGTATFNDTSSNIGTVVNNATFNDSSSNTSIIQGSALFYGNNTSNTGTISGIKTRYYTATTTTTLNLTGWKVVADGAQVNVTGATFDSTTVFNAINGGSFMGGPTTVYWYSGDSDANWTTVGNWYSIGSSTPLGRVASSTEMVVVLGSTVPTIDLATTTWVQPSGIDATLTGIVITSATAETIDIGITGSTTLSGAVTNTGIISGNTTILGTSKNGSGGIIDGTAKFYDSTENNGVVSGDAEFYDDSINTNGGSIYGDAEFNDQSYNDTDAGNIGGTATFNDTAYNDGVIDFNAVFGNNASENNGTVSGLKTRYFTANSTVNRNFVTGGPWILVADGVEVTVASTSVFNATTTFSEVNGGNFVGEGIPGSYTTCARSLYFPGTYTLLEDTESTCDIQSDGVTIDGNGYTLGTAASPFPDNGASASWVDMTSNVLLYHAEDITGNIYTDSSGSSNSTSCTTFCPPLSNNGYFGKAISSVPNVDKSIITPIDGAAVQSYSMWAKGDGWLAASHRALSNSGEWAWGIYNPTSIIWMNGLEAWGTNSLLGSLPNDNEQNWNHYVLVHNGTQHFLYVNGVEIDNYTGVSVTNTWKVSIGSAHDTHSQYLSYMFNGLIDEVAIWNRALSATEVEDIYIVQSTGMGGIDGNSYDFDVMDMDLARISSPGSTINVTNVTVGSINVSGTDSAGDAQAGGTINMINSTSTSLLANGGDSTDYGFGGAAGDINFTNSTSTSQSAVAGTNGPNKGTGQENTGGSTGSSSSISGCTDSGATNYNANATVSNNSCVYSSTIVRGCMNPGATNYNANATVSNGSCTYPVYSAPSNSGNGNNTNTGNTNNAGNGGGSSIGSVSLSTALINALNLKPLPFFDSSVGSGIGDTVLGNPLSGLKPFGLLNLGSIRFSFVLPISEFIFAPLPKSITDIFKKSPQISNVLASAGVSRAQDLVKLNNSVVKLAKNIDGTPGLFNVTEGTTTLDTYITSDKRHDLLQLVYTNPGAILNVSLIPINGDKTTGMFEGKNITFFDSSDGSSVYAVITSPDKIGRYYINTDSAPTPLAIDVITPKNIEVVRPIPWWKKVLRWFRLST